MERPAHETVKQILEQARIQFPVDQVVTRTSHLNFERWAEQFLHSGQELGKL